jgi:hypothetical protein
VTPALLASVRGLAAEGGAVVRIAGGCMAPGLEGGATLAVAPARWYWPGDVVACLSAGRIVAHRVIGYRPKGGRLWVFTQADRAATPDSPVPLGRVLGRLSAPVSFGDRVSAVGRWMRHLGARAATRLS